MQNEKIINLIKVEIEAVLSDLSAGDFHKLVRESLTVTGRGFSETKGQPFFIGVLPLIIYDSISSQYEKAIPVAAAMQFLLAAGDILDDVEDADSPESFAATHGPAVATNTATTLIILAEKAILRLQQRGVKPETITQVADSINSFYVTACFGQHLDLLSGSSIITEDEYLKMAGLKSAAQLECACHSGALLAGANLKLIDIFSQFGHNLGMAAQITNDILGITRNKDILKRKITLPVIFALSQTKGDIHKQLDIHFQKDQPSEQDPEKIKGLIFNTGAIHYATVKKELYKQMALDNLKEAEAAGADIDKIKPLVYLYE